MNDGESGTTPACGIAGVDLSGVEIARLDPYPAPSGHAEALALADAEAERRLGDVMLLSWYDRDRDLESPRHASECHANSAVPGYVDYGLSHGAKLMVDISNGRFVFFYLPLDDNIAATG